MRRNANADLLTDVLTFSALGGAVGAIAWALRSQSAAKPPSDGLPKMEPYQEAPPPVGPGSVTPMTMILPVKGEAIDPSDKIAAAMIDAARRDLGVRETSYNWGPRVEQMLRNVGVITPQEWCAAAISTWTMGAFKTLGTPVPMKGSDTPNLLVRQFQDPANAPKMGWVDGDEIRTDSTTLQPGMIIFYRARTNRGSANHVALVEQRIDDTFYGTIDGNSGPGEDMVARSKRRYDAPGILGAGYFRPAAIPPEIV